MAKSLHARPGRGTWLALALVGALAGGCAQAPMKQSGTHIGPEAAPAPGAIPAPVQVSPVLPKPKPTPKPETYSVVVNGVKVQELLFAVARDARLNIDIHPGISGVVTLNAIDQTLPQLLSRIAKQVDMRWELSGPNLLVMPDTPYLRVYKIDYVNMERVTQGQVGVSTQIATPGGGAAGGAGGAGAAAAGGGNTSTTSVNYRSSNKFWDTLVENIKDILRETDKVVSALAQPAAAAPGAPGAGAGASAAPGAAAAPAAPAPPGATFREAASVISNPEAGVVIIRATSRQHEKIQEFLDQVLVSAKRQVMIEATVAEVQLNNNYQQGVDWSLFRRGPAGFAVSQSALGTSAAGVNSSLLVVDYIASNVSATLRFLESFGNVRVLSSPKISVLNNQTAILKVVDNRVYFTIKADTTSNQTSTQTAFTTTPNVVPVGFVMNVTPQISDTDIILLNLKPTVSRIVGFVNDPNPSLANPCGIGVNNCATPSIVSRIPEIQTREMESMLKVNSGQTAIMGGLIQDSINDAEDAVPGLSADPVFGVFFTHRNRVNAKTELVIFIRPVAVKDPSMDGDFRAMRGLLPDQDFIAGPNPGKALPRRGEARP
ncbi:MAG: secretin N-terminal domain-containing protein [Betaproteobacteria bacterium]|nr:secretin N-terminal domain-containing protein [Betaproteobacteria bacterium]